MALALYLSRAGHKVTIVERFDTPKPLGSGLLLQPPGLDVLDELGLGDAVRQYGCRIERIFGQSMPAQRTVLDVRYDILGEGQNAVAIHRAQLFEILHEGLEAAGVTIVAGQTVSRTVVQESTACFESEGGRKLGPFDLLVDASGSGSSLIGEARPAARRLSLPFGALWGNFDPDGLELAGDTLSQRYVGAHTMVGVMPVGTNPSTGTDQVAFFWSLRADALDAWRRRGLDRWKTDVETLWPALAPIVQQIRDPAQLTFAAYGHHTLKRPFDERIAFVGDAAHSTSPQLGQGANMALLDACALARALEDQSDTRSALKAYAAARRRHVRLFQLASLTLTGFYQSESRLLAGLRDLVFGPLGRTPGLRRLAARLVSGTLTSPIRGD